MDANDFLADAADRRVPGGQADRGAVPASTRSGCSVWVLVMEEFQVYFELADQKVNKDIAALLSFILAVGPSAGVILRRPVAEAVRDRRGRRRRGCSPLPRQPRGAVRAQVRQPQVSEASSAPSAYAEGYDASALPPAVPRASASCYGAPTRRRPSGPTSPTAADAELILLAARRAPRAGRDADRLWRPARTRTPRPRRPRRRARRVRRRDAGLHWDVLAERLAARIPDRWAGATATRVSAQCATSACRAWT